MLGLTCPVAQGDAGAVDPLAPEPTAIERLTLRRYLERVLQHNESLQVRLLEMEVSRLRMQGERGVFLPDLVGGYEHVDSIRPNTAEQQRQQFTSFFDERNNIYSAAIESLIATGARVRLGYSLSDLRNNLQDTTWLSSGTNGGEFLSFAGVNIVQPLLRNRGSAATLAGVRMAAVASDVAFQDYRRQLMQVVSQAESLYWQLFFAQEQHRFFRESVAVAENLLNNNRARLRLGTASELDVLEAESGLALRRSRQAEARQKRIEISNALIGLYSSTVMQTNLMLEVTDRPALVPVASEVYTAWREAIECNPEYLAAHRKIAGEIIRKAHARNQLLPQLDLKGSFGWYGLSDDPSDSFADVRSGDWPAWTVGAELRVPLGVGTKARYEYDQARLRQKQAELQLQDLENQIVNALDTSLRNVQSTVHNIANYQKVAEFYQNLFETQQKRLELGAIDSQKLLETEEKLFEAKNSVAESLVRHERARIELELVKGTLLRSRHLELNRSDLERRTAALLTRNLLPGDRYDYFLQELKTEFDRQRPAEHPDRSARDRALDVLRKTITELDRPQPMTVPADHSDPAVLNKALEALDQELRQPQPRE